MAHRVNNFPFACNVRLKTDMGEAMDKAIADGYEEDRSDFIRRAIGDYLSELGVDFGQDHG